MKRLLLFLALVAACDGMAQKLARYRLDFELSQRDFVDSVRIEWDRNQVYVPVTIDGQVYRFLLDTGSGQAVVYDDTPIEGCLPAGQMRSLDAIGRCDTVEVVTLPPLTLGTVTFTGCRATVQHRPVRGRSFDGIVGFDIIARGLNVKIDVRDSLMIVSDRKNFFEQEAGYEAPYKLDFHVPYIEISPFGRYKERTLFDTGSRQFYAINKGSFDQGMNGAAGMLGVQIQNISEGRHAIGNFGAEPEGEVVYMTLDAMKWGKFVFSDVETMTTQGGSHIGADILNYGAVVFNPRRKRVKFMPYNEEASCSVVSKLPDIAFVSDNGQPAVGVVRQGTLPYQQGFRSGDIIIAVEGQPVKDFTEFITRAYEVGREYRFKIVDRQGREKEVRWVRIPHKKKNNQ